jgi:hypothetical protein
MQRSTHCLQTHLNDYKGEVLNLTLYLEVFVMAIQAQHGNGLSKFYPNASIFLICQQTLTHVVWVV